MRRYSFITRRAHETNFERGIEGSSEANALRAFRPMPSLYLIICFSLRKDTIQNAEGENITQVLNTITVVKIRNIHETIYIYVCTTRIQWSWNKRNPVQTASIGGLFDFITNTYKYKPSELTLAVLY